MKRMAFLIPTLALGLLTHPIVNADEPAPAGDSLDARIVQLSQRGTRATDVLRLLGKPAAYLWGQARFTPTNLPQTYIMSYTNGVAVLLSAGTVRELRSEPPGPGFTWRGKLRLGSTLEEVLQVVGPPSQTVVGKPLGFSPGVLYKDTNGKTGYCYYSRPDQNVRFFFGQYKVTALYLPIEDYQVSASASGECFKSPRTALSPQGSLTIVRRPEPFNFQRGQLQALPAYSAQLAHNPFQVDLRGFDLSHLDVRQRLSDLQHADFDTRTRWPKELPSGFEPEKIMTLSKDPGLGIRQVHAKGFTGKGIGIGMIDQTLLTGHQEYQDRLRLYEEIHCPQSAAQMHGPAVASLAIGRTVGVAPEAELYYIAQMHGESKGPGQFEADHSWTAKSIDRLLEVNAGLPREKKIRVMSLSLGWSPDQRGYQEVLAAVERAKKAGVFVLSTALAQTHRLAFHGLGREPMADPNAFASYCPGSWWAREFWQDPSRFAPGHRLLVPMDARCTASPTGENDYVYYSGGGWSWSVPWIAGLYALACQVQPEMTPERFWRQALATGQTITLHQNGTEIPFGTIASPLALLESLQRETK